MASVLLNAGSPRCFAIATGLSCTIINSPGRGKGINTMTPCLDDGIEVVVILLCEIYLDMPVILKSSAGDRARGATKTIRFLVPEVAQADFRCHRQFVFTCAEVAESSIRLRSDHRP